jgi:hypothetical protein
MTQDSTTVSSSRATNDYDNPWKGMLDRFLEAFLLLFFPNVHCLIDWSHPYESLSTDLLKFTKNSHRGGRIADRAFKVHLRTNGNTAILLIHIEVQAQYDPKFTERMFIYFYRLFDRFHLPIISMALLTDGDPNWKPSAFHQSTGPMQLRMDFPVTKLLDFQAQVATLEASDNPFSIIALAHLHNLQLRKSPADLKVAKIDVTRLLL